MGTGDDEAALAGDIETLRALVDKLLDEGTRPSDPALVASSLVLSDKLAQLQQASTRPPAVG
jgi:hypothetical protein